MGRPVVQRLEALQLAPSERLLLLRLRLRQGPQLACMLSRCECLLQKSCQHCVLGLLQTRPCCLQLLLWGAGAGLFPPFLALQLWEAWVAAAWAALSLWCCLLMLLPLP